MFIDEEVDDIFLEGQFLVGPEARLDAQWEQPHEVYRRARDWRRYEVPIGALLVTEVGAVARGALDRRVDVSNQVLHVSHVAEKVAREYVSVGTYAAWSDEKYCAQPFATLEVLPVYISAGYARGDTLGWQR